MTSVGRILSQFWRSSLPRSTCHVRRFGCLTGDRVTDPLCYDTQVRTSSDRLFMCGNTSRGIHTSVIQCKKKGREKKKGLAVAHVGTIETVLNVELANSRMDECLQAFIQDMQHSLALRSDIRAYTEMPITLEDGSVHRLDTIAQVVQKNPTLVLLNLAARPNLLPIVKTAIDNSGLNVNVQQQGSTLMVPLVRVTKEYRQQLAANAVTMNNNYKKQLNDLFKELNHDVNAKKGAAGVSVNDTKTAVAFLLDLKKKYEERGDEAVEKKQAELLREIR